MERLAVLKKAAAMLFLLGMACLLAAGCTQEDNFGVPPGAVGNEGSNASKPNVTNPDFQRTPPPVKMPQLGDVQTTRDEGGQSAMVDTSYMNDGYISASCSASTRTRVRITHQDTGANDDYEIDNDGTVNHYPLTRGNGSYSIVIYIQIEADSYDPFITASGSATIADEKAPYLIPTRLVRYDENSKCVQGSYDITEHCATDLEVTQQVVRWIVQNVKYDDIKAEELGSKPSAYEPLPDDTYQSKTGICYDYASLSAAMLRANGIPTKLVKGEVTTPEGQTIRHAWNMVWLEETGWIVADLPTKPNDWTRFDTTFSATAGDSISRFVGDGKNYTPISEH